MKRFFACLLTLVLLLSLSACSAGTGAKNTPRSSVEYVTSAKSSLNLASFASDEGSNVIPLTDGRKLVKTVREEVETDAYDSLTDALNEALATLGGYISRSNLSGSAEAGDRYAYYVIRVPAEKLTELTGKLGENGVVTDYTETVGDVTVEYVDIESRITVLEAEETALTAMLSNATDVTTLLAIRSQLTNVQQDLASLREQKRVYDDEVAYSTVYLTVYEVERVSPVGNRSFFEEVGVTFLDSLAGIGNFFRGLGVGLLGGSPYLLLIAAIGAGIFFLVHTIQKRMKKERDEMKNGRE